MVGRGKFRKPQGEQWLISTMNCLERVLVPDLVDMEKIVYSYPEGEQAAKPRSAATLRQIRNEKCQALKVKGYASHAQCYLDAGLCELYLEDWMAIVEIVKLKTIFDTAYARKAAFEIIGGCMKRWTSALGRKLQLMD